MNPLALHAVVIGAGGLVSGELLRLLSLHPVVGKITAVSKSQAGKAAHEVHPSLLHLPDIPLVNVAAEDAAKGADAVFFALPHGKSMHQMKRVLACDPRCVVDLAADFRLHDPEQFAADYEPHVCPQLLDRFAYGLPEAFGPNLRGSRFIANPGCFASAAQLALLPLAANKLLEGPTGVFAVTGSSGSGIRPKPTTHHPFRSGNLYAYKALAHQHEGEINQTLTELSGTPQSVRLLAHSGPFVRGIHATVYQNRPALADHDVPGLYQSYYQNAPFVAVLDRPPQVAEVAGTNFVHLFVAQSGPEIQIALTLDNLVKGAAGQAIQNMNLVLGLPETAGLNHPGAFPC